jgi:hypothetical protein
LEEDLRALARSLARVGRDIATAPSRWRARDWALLCAFLGATYAAYRDKWLVQSFVEGTGGSAGRAVAETADVLGSGVATVCYGVAAFVVGRWAKKRALVDAAIALGARGAWCWALTEAGRLVLAESRPIQGGAMHWMALGGHGVSGQRRPPRSSSGPCVTRSSETCAAPLVASPSPDCSPGRSSSAGRASTSANTSCGT